MQIWLAVIYQKEDAKLMFKVFIRILFMLQLKHL